MDKRADQFSNKDLLDYAKLMADNIDKAQKQIQTVDATPMIQINQQNNVVNVNSDDVLDRDSRRRIMEAAKAAMEFLKNQQEQKEIEENQENISENCENDTDEIVYNSDGTEMLSNEEE